MAEICDIFAGWGDINHKWAHCRGAEEACLTIELLSVTSAYAYVGVDPSWRDKEGRAINKGEYIEYMEGDTRWRVYCDDVNTSQNLASIRICYDEAGDDEEGMEVGDSRTVDGIVFTITEMICTPVQQIVAKVEGLSKTVKVGAIVIFPGPIVGTLLYIGLKSINAACDHAIVEAAGGGFEPEEVEEIDNLLSGYKKPDGTEATPEEIHEIKMKVIDGLDFTDQEYLDMVKKLLDGVITQEEFDAWLKQYVIDQTKERIDTIYYAANFSLEIPSIVMAGDIEVSGTAPQANQKLQIKAVKKWFGFDWLAKDPVLAEVTSDAEYKYKATLKLEEFGAISVYACIPKDWWGILEADVETTKHSVWVLTWTVVLALVAALALAYDKKMKGKFIGIFKKR